MFPIGKKKISYFIKNNQLILRFTELPKKNQALPTNASKTDQTKKSTISQFFSSSSCVICDIHCEKVMCDDCRKNVHESSLILSNKIFHIERKYQAVNEMCATCCMRSFDTDCVSLDCPILYSLTKIKREYKQVGYLRDILKTLN